MSKNEYIKIKGWGNALAWSPSGKTLTVAIHNSTFIKVEFDANMASVKKYLSVCRNLPVTSIFYSGEDTLVASGYDAVPFIFKNEDSKWLIILLILGY